MKFTLYPLFVFLAFFFGFMSTVQAYTTNVLPFTDVPNTREIQVTLSTLYAEKVVQGNPDGTIALSRTVNRAEAIEVLMRLIRSKKAHVNLGCFPDVPSGAWYEYSVCRAKALGIVRGNSVEGIAQNKWLFAPERSVNYSEALKMLFEIFEAEIPKTPGQVWYQPYLLLAAQQQLELPENLSPDTPLTRGDLFRLAVRFFAWQRNELPELFAAFEGKKLPIVPAVNNPVALGMVVPGNAVSDMIVEDELSPVLVQRNWEHDVIQDRSERSRYLLLGEVSGVLGTVRFFNGLEPTHIDEVYVRFTNEVRSIQSILIFGDDGRLFGNAFLDPHYPGNRQYVLNIRPGITIPDDQEFRLYVRALLYSFKDGGLSGELAQLDSISVKGYGVLSSAAYEKSGDVSGEFYIHQTSRGRLAEVRNADATHDTLIAGSNVRLGSFSVKGYTSDPSAQLYIPEMHFSLYGDATVSNVHLQFDGGTSIPCTLVLARISCTGIDPLTSSLENLPRLVTVRGDVSPTSAFSTLQIAITNPGTPSTPGDIVLHDGDTAFTWVEGPNPLAQSTRFE